MDQPPGNRRRFKVLLGVGYLVVLLVLLLIPSPGTVVTLAAVVWVGIGVVLAIRAAPPTGRPSHRRGRTAMGERGGRGASGQASPRGRRGDNPHR